MLIVFLVMNSDDIWMQRLTVITSAWDVEGVEEGDVASVVGIAEDDFVCLIDLLVSDSIRRPQFLADTLHIAGGEPFERAAGNVRNAVSVVQRDPRLQHAIY